VAGASNLTTRETSVHIATVQRLTPNAADTTARRQCGSGRSLALCVDGSLWRGWPRGTDEGTNSLYLRQLGHASVSASP